MRFSIQREALLKPLTQVVGVVERRQTMPVLANILIEVTNGSAGFTASDLEVELSARCVVEDSVDGVTTLPARKLYDIVRALPDGSRIDISQSGERVTLKTGRSKFTLATLPASEFLTVDDIDVIERISLSESTLKELLDRTAFAMAHQDVRYYLNGMLLDLHEGALRCVATDGHRLALCETEIALAIKSKRQIIIPRKGKNHLRVTRSDFVLTSKLIDGRFPDYEAVIPIGADKIVQLPRDELRMALQRVAILSNEKYRGVKLDVAPGRLTVVAHNPEQEEATETLEVQTVVDGLNVGFNVNYLQDALAALRGVEVMLCLRDGNSSCLVRDADNNRARHVVMPLRL
jgi:DNA polymerase III subunit beta